MESSKHAHLIISTVAVVVAVAVAHGSAAADAPSRPPAKPPAKQLAKPPPKAERHTYTRKQSAAPAAVLSERAKPSAAKAAATESRPARPQIDSDLALSLEGIRSTFRAEQEDLLVDLIRRTPDRDADDKAKLYFMLGELYASQSRYYRLRSQELALAGRAPSDAKAKADRNLVRAVMTYKELTDNPAFRNFPKLDQALFYFGYMLRSAGKHDDARAVYDRLIKNYPSSKYVPEAHMVFADYFFERSELANAESRYRMVLKFPQSPVYWFARYKSGWIDLQLNRHQQALEAFYQVAQATQREPKLEILNRAAKKDFVRAYAEIGKSELAYAAFARVDTALALEMFQWLADIYLEQGKSDRAIYVLRDLMKRAPKHANVCLWQYEIAQATLSLPGATAADRVREIEDLARLYGALRAAKSLPAAAADECRENALVMTGDHARALHSEQARTQNPETLVHVEKLYRIYLETFPDAPEHPSLEYFYGELLWTRALAEKSPALAIALWERAADVFTGVVKRNKVVPAMRKEAAYAAVLGWKNALDINPSVRGEAEAFDEKVYDTVPVPRPIPEREAKLLAAYDVYLTSIDQPGDEDLIRMKFYKANLYRRYHHYDKAIPLFADVLAKHRTHEAAELAAQLLLDSYHRLHHYDELVALAQRLAADKEFLADKPELRDVVVRLQFQAQAKRAEGLAEQARASKDFAKSVACGEAYMALYNSDPERVQNDEVLYNAMVCFHDGKSIGLAIVAYELLAKYYGKSKLMPRALARIGKAYGDSGFYDKSAEKLEQYARAYAGESDAAQVMSEVVFFNKGTGEDAKAIANTKYFVDTFGAKRPGEAATAMFSLTSVYEKRGEPDALVRHLRAYLERFGAQGGADRRVIAYAKIGQALWAASCPVELVDGSCVRVVRERAIDRRAPKARTLQTQCGDATKSKLTVVARDPRKVRDAMAAFAAAAAEWEKVGGKTGGDDRLARHYYAQSKLIEADRDYEVYLAVGLPKDLDFDRADASTQARSRKRFDEWLVRSGQAATAAKEKYDAALRVTDNATSIAAAARIAQLVQNRADALFTTEIPLTVRTGRFAEDKIDAFCDRMTEVADPLEATAIAGYEACLEQSRRLGWYSEWSKLCERELGQIRPNEHPTASELRAEPDRRAAIVVSEGPVQRLE